MTSLAALTVYWPDGGLHPASRNSGLEFHVLYEKFQARESASQGLEKIRTLQLLFDIRNQHTGLKI